MLRWDSKYQQASRRRPTPLDRAAARSAIHYSKINYGIKLFKEMATVEIFVAISMQRAHILVAIVLLFQENAACNQ
jgi:hypothetical protein